MRAPVRRSRHEPTADWQQLRLLVTSPEQAAYELLRPIVHFGRSARARARETGVPERTLRRKVEGFEARGMRSLFDQPARLSTRRHSPTTAGRSRRWLTASMQTTASKAASGNGRGWSASWRANRARPAAPRVRLPRSPP